MSSANRLPWTSIRAIPSTPKIGSLGASLVHAETVSALLSPPKFGLVVPMPTLPSLPIRIRSESKLAPLALVNNARSPADVVEAGECVVFQVPIPAVAAKDCPSLKVISEKFPGVKSAFLMAIVPGVCPLPPLIEVELSEFTTSSFPSAGLVVPMPTLPPESEFRTTLLPSSCKGL